MKKDDGELQRKIRIHREIIYKNGTYTLEIPAAKEEPNLSEPDLNEPDLNELDLAKMGEEGYEDINKGAAGAAPDIDEEALRLYESIMPNRTEDRVQQSINAMVSEQDAKVAEIMRKFENNIQNNVSALFEMQ